MKANSKPSIGEEQEETQEALDDLHRWLFFWCRVLGIHVVTTNRQGEYMVSAMGKTKTVVMVVLNVVNLGAASQKLFLPIPFWFFVVLFSIVCGYAFCVYTFVHTCWNAGRMKRYMDAFGRVPVPVPVPRRRFGCSWVMVGGTCYPLLIAVSMCFLLSEWTLVFPSVFFSSAVPAMLDAYMLCFSSGLKMKLQGLASEVKRRDSWKTEEVGDLSLRWVAVTQLLQEHNNVRTVGLLMSVLTLYFFVLILLHRSFVQNILIY